MARPPRLLVAGGFYHVIARGVAGESIVLDDDDRRAFLRLLHLTARAHGWRLQAFCLMSSHLHLVVETPKPNLSRGMQRLLSRHAQEFNVRWQRFGHLFADRYWSRLVENDEYLEDVCRYVLDNPVSAGIVRSAADWPWSGGLALSGLSGV